MTNFQPLEMEKMVGREKKPYQPSDRLLEAVHVALACEMPLLLTGEPGCGKTDFAWAVASVLDRDLQDGKDRSLLECHVRSDTRARDLLYHFDAVRRFGDSQLQNDEDQARARKPANYISLQPLGRALVSEYRRVVLIDEIDKAPRDLPNDLLRALDERKFEIPELVSRASESKSEDDASLSTGVRSYGHELRPLMKSPKDGQRSLIIITSNVERQLPEPFLRRCVFFHIRFPKRKRLESILEAHFGDRCSIGLRNQALKVFLALRRYPNLTKKPATAEFLTWMQALTTVFEPELVEERLGEAAARVDEEKARSDVDWERLPGLSSLLKLREDFETVGLSDGAPV